MTYYILPKTNNDTPLINPVFFDTEAETETMVISNSVRMRRDILLNQVSTMVRNNNKPRQKLFSKKAIIEEEEPVIVAPSTSPPSSTSSTHSTSSPLLQEFNEIISIFNIADLSKYSRPIECLNFSCLPSSEILRGLNFNAKITSPKSSLQSYAVNLKRLNIDLEFGLMFFDISSCDSYSQDLFCALFVVLMATSNGGFAVVKMTTMTLQLELDIIYVLNHVFDKAFLLKPDSSNPVSNDKYIVCKHFLKKRSATIISQIVPLIESSMKKHIGKLLCHSLPSTFLTKIEEINVIIGQKQMDALSQLINSTKHKSMEDTTGLVPSVFSNECSPWHNKTSANHNAFNPRLFKHQCKQPQSDSV